MKHKHHEAIKAFADGKRCSWWDNVNQHWHQIRSLQEFDWCETVQVDPEPKPDIVDYLSVSNKSAQDLVKLNWVKFDTANLRLTWDGETLELIDAEVIK